MSTLAKYEVILIKNFTIYPYTISNLGITNTKKLHGNKIYETKQKNMFNDLCRVLVTASEDILDIFKEKQIQ